MERQARLPTCSLQPARPSPSRPRSALSPQLPRIEKSLFVAPRNHFSFSAPVLLKTLSRANPSRGQLLLPLLPSSRLHRASRSWTLSPLLPLQPRLLCLPNSNRVPSGAVPLLLPQLPLLPSPAIQACFQKPKAAIQQQFSPGPALQASLRILARSRPMGTLESVAARGGVVLLWAPAFPPRAAARLALAARLPLRQ